LAEVGGTYGFSVVLLATVNLFPGGVGLGVFTTDPSQDIGVARQYLYFD